MPQRTIGTVVAALLWTAVATAQSHDVAGTAAMPLRPERLYAGLNRPLVLEVAALPVEGPLTVSLMNAEGNLHVAPIEVSPGAVDLSLLVPELPRLRRTAYLQLFDGPNPIGAPVVVQPMLSRMVPVTRDATSPSGHTYTEVIGWYDENFPERRAAIEAAAAEPPSEEEDVVPADDPWLANAAPDDRVITGFRLYVEQDVTLVTSEGVLRIALAPDAAPNTAWNFRHLAGNGFYRDVSFHRIVPATRDGDPFVVQGGDPSGTGSGGPGYWLPMEPSDLPHDFGVLSMARDVPPDSAGSQFFIALSRAGTARLDGSYCAFGYVVEGAEVIERLAATELADFDAGRPIKAPRIERALLVPSPPRPAGVSRAEQRVRPTAETAEPVKPKPNRVPR